MIDLDHMSQATQEAVVAIAEQTRAKTNGLGYPLLFGHGGIRGDTERLPPRDLVERVARLGRMFGAGTVNATAERFIHDMSRSPASWGLARLRLAPMRTASSGCPGGAAIAPV